MAVGERRGLRRRRWAFISRLRGLANTGRSDGLLLRVVSRLIRVYTITKRKREFGECFVLRRRKLDR